MEAYPESREWIEGYPYIALMSLLGTPEIDYDTWAVVTYPDQMYWFDYEGFMIGQDYYNILEGIGVLSGGAAAITDISFDDRDVNWEEGSGKLEIRFFLNGTSCIYQARVQYDWLDPGIFSYLNKMLKGTGVKERVWLTGDGGQGAILFFREQVWADKFAREIGIPLEASLNLSNLVDSAEEK